MTKRRKLIVVLAVVGFAITALFWAYSAFRDYSKPMNRADFALTGVFIAVCPPSLLSIPFWETEPDTAPGIVIWLVIGLLNSALYAAIGAVLGRRLWRLDNPVAPPPPS